MAGAGRVAELLEHAAAGAQRSLEAFVWLSKLLSGGFGVSALVALIALGVWLFFVFIWPSLASVLAQVISPPDVRYVLLGLPTPGTIEMQQTLARFSPNQLFAEQGCRRGQQASIFQCFHIEKRTV